MTNQIEDVVEDEYSPAFKWVFAESKTKGPGRMILIVLAFYSDDDWDCRLTDNEIAWKARLTLDKNKRVMRALLKAGLVSALDGGGYRVLRTDAMLGKILAPNSKRREMSASARYKAIANLVERSGWLCAYCAGDLTMLTVTLDHRVALANGGTHDIENLCLACRSCNSSKGAKLAFTVWNMNSHSLEPSLIEPRISNSERAPKADDAAERFAGLRSSLHKG